MKYVQAGGQPQVLQTCLNMVITGVRVGMSCMRLVCVVCETGGEGGIRADSSMAAAAHDDTLPFSASLIVVTHVRFFHS